MIRHDVVSHVYEFELDGKTVKCEAPLSVKLSVALRDQGYTGEIPADLDDQRMKADEEASA